MSELKVPGELREHSGNTPIVLGQADKVWQVAEGTLALFAVNLRDSVPVGSRRYLFDLGPGDLMYSTGGPMGMGVLAVPVGEAKVVHSDQATLNDVARGKGRAIGLQLETWIERWNTYAEHFLIEAPDPPMVPTPLREWESEEEKAEAERAEQARLAAEKAEAEAAERAEAAEEAGAGETETEAAEGEAPAAPAPLPAAPAPMPVGEPAEGELPPTPAPLPEQPPAWASLNLEPIWGQLRTFHKSLLVQFNRASSRDREVEQARVVERSRISRESMSHALRGIATLLQRKGGPVPMGTDLYVACYLVGRELGIKIKPPMNADDPARVRTPVELIARSSHVRIRRVLLGGEWWREDSGPLLAYFGDDERPIALLSDGIRDYRYYDPQDRQLKPVTEEVAEQIQPAAYTFYRQLPEDFSKPWDVVQFAMHGRHREIITMFSVGIAATLLGMLSPHAMKILMDHAIPNSDKSLLIQLGFGLFMVSLGGTLFGLSRSFAMARMSTYADNHTQSAIWDRLLKLKPEFFQQYSVGDLQARSMAINSIRGMLTGTTMSTLFTSFMAILNLGLLLYYSFKLTLVAAAVALITSIITITTGVLLYRINKQLLARGGHVFGIVVQLINGASKLRVAGAEERAFSYWATEVQVELNLGLKIQVITDIVMIVNIIIGSLSTLVIYYVAAGLLLDPTSGMSYGTFLAFNAAYGAFVGGVGSLSNTFTSILSIFNLQERAKPILEAEVEVTEDAADPGRIKGQIIIDSAVFRYREDGPLILNDVSIRAEPGEFIALVGPSGSGKSTVLRLLLGFNEPESGRVLIDGQDMFGLDLNAVRRQMGVVLQNGRINASSIFENIACETKVSLAEAWEAAESAGFGEDIRRMPMQMHTMISEGGTNLSGGQRQRLLIARALATRPKIVLFDEATSALDNHTQSVITRSLDKMAVTRVTIAHRLSTIRHADRIYVLDAGRVVQAGNFQQLSEEEGLFKRLMQRQMA